MTKNFQQCQNEEKSLKKIIGKLYAQKDSFTARCNAIAKEIAGLIDSVGKRSSEIHSTSEVICQRAVYILENGSIDGFEIKSDEHADFLKSFETTLKDLQDELKEQTEEAKELKDEIKVYEDKLKFVFNDVLIKDAKSVDGLPFNESKEKHFWLTVSDFSEEGVAHYEQEVVIFRDTISNPEKWFILSKGKEIPIFKIPKWNFIIKTYLEHYGQGNSSNNYSHDDNTLAFGA